MSDRDLPGVWRAVLQLERRPPYKWLAELDLVSIEGNTAHLTPRLGSEHLLTFAEGPPGKHLAELLQRVIGRPMMIRIDERQARRPAPGGASGAAPGPATNSNQPESRQAKMQRAHQLPLVQDIMELFRADLVDVREMKPQPPAEDETNAAGESGEPEPPPKPSQAGANPADELPLDEDDDDED